MMHPRKAMTPARAMIIAATGGHNILLVGPLGTGKTALAQWMARLLSPLTDKEAYEVTAIHTARGGAVPAVRPFRAPHHTVGIAGLIGGGTAARPGEVSLAHNGVLLLDELPEFRRLHLEAIAGVLSDGQVTVSKGGASVRFPARPAVVVGAMNPCPCGWAGVEGWRRCICSARDTQAYRARIPAALLRSFDICVRLDSPAASGLPAVDSPEGAALAAQVAHAQARAMARGGLNGRLSGVQLAADPYRWDAQDLAPTEGMSAGAFERLLRVARTIADLDNSDDVRAGHVTEALQLCPEVSYGA